MEYKYANAAVKAYHLREIQIDEAMDAAYEKLRLAKQAAEHLLPDNAAYTAAIRAAQIAYNNEVVAIHF